MRRFGWTGLVAGLIMMALMAAVTASASPGGARAGATLRFEMTVGDAVAQPFDRWLQELAGLAALSIESETWKDGEAMALRCAMDGNEAWTVSLLSDEAGVSMASSLMDAGAVTLNEADAAEARALMSWMRLVASGPEEQKLTAVQFAGIARGAAATLTRWGTAAAGTEGETVGALAGFLSALAGIAEGAGGATWLTVSVEPDEGTPVIVAEGTAPAPAELPGVLVMEGFWATMRAITAG